MPRYKRKRRVATVRRAAAVMTARSKRYNLIRLTGSVPKDTGDEIRAKAKQFDVTALAIISAALLHGLRTISARHIVAFATRYPDLCRNQMYAMHKRRTEGHPNALRTSPSTDEQAPASRAAA